MKQKRKGFTLIELLVVIAIIAILAAILYPVYSKVRDRATGTACLNNAKQIAMALSLYREDNEGYSVMAWTPDSAGANSQCGRLGNAWYDTLRSLYLKSNVFGHKPLEGQEANGCRGLMKPTNGSLLSANTVVHARNLVNAYGVDPQPGFDTWAETYWTGLDTKDIGASGLYLQGTQRGWAATLNESEVHTPSRLITAVEGGACAAMPSAFLYRGVFHRTFDAGLHGLPIGNAEHGLTATAIYFDGHVLQHKVSILGGDFGDPRMWNNSPYDDGGGWNRNRSSDSNDDKYHGDGKPGDYPRPVGSYKGWIPVDQLYTDISLGGTDNVLRQGSWSAAAYQTIFDEDMTFGEYNTVERPDAKYDE